MKNKKSLGSKILSGSIWTVLMRTSIRLLGIISILILARILSPDDFGIVAKATMIYGFLELVSQFGFENALIKKQDAKNEDYNTVWTLSIIRSLFLCIILLILAVPLSEYFHEPELTQIIICYAVISFAKGWINVGVIDFRKKMIFSLDFKFNFINKINSFIATIAIAYIYQTYWSLVIGAFINIFSAVIVSYLMSDRRPRLELSKWKEIFEFSKWIFGFELINAISSKLDLFILSRYSTTENVGLYTVSYEIAGTPSSEISMPIARAALPGLSKLNQDSRQFRKMYNSIVSMVLFIAIPASIGLSAVAELATLVLLGEKWLMASELIEVLALFGLVRVINAVSISAYIAFDRPDVLTKLSTLNLFLRLILLPSGMYFGGIIGLCWSIVVSAALSATISIVIQERIRMIDFIQITRSIYRALIASLLMWYVIKAYPFREFSIPVVDLVFQVVIGGLIFLTATYSMHYFSKDENSPEKKALDFVLRRI